MLSTDLRARLSPRERNATTTPTMTCEIESLGKTPGYRVNRIPQRAGDRSRAPVREAEHLARLGKARIVPNTNKVEML